MHGIGIYLPAGAGDQLRRDESRLYEGEIIKNEKKVCGGVHGMGIYLYVCGAKVIVRGQ